LCSCWLPYLSSLLSLAFPSSRASWSTGAIAGPATLGTELGQRVSCIVAILLAALGLQAAMLLLSFVAFAQVGEPQPGRLPRDTYARLIHLRWPFMPQRRVGELTSRISADLSQITAPWSAHPPVSQRTRHPGRRRRVDPAHLGEADPVQLCSVPPLIVVPSCRPRDGGVAGSSGQAGDSNVIVEESPQHPERQALPMSAMSCTAIGKGYKRCCDRRAARCPVPGKLWRLSSLCPVRGGRPGVVVRRPPGAGRQPDPGSYPSCSTPCFVAERWVRSPLCTARSADPRCNSKGPELLQGKARELEIIEPFPTLDRRFPRQETAWRRVIRQVTFAPIAKGSTGSPELSVVARAENASLSWDRAEPANRPSCVVACGIRSRQRPHLARRPARRDYPLSDLRRRWLWCRRTCCSLGHHRGEHRLRQTWLHGGRDRRRGPEGQRHDFIAGFPMASDAGRRPESTFGGKRQGSHRSSDPQESGDLDSRRGDQLADSRAKPDSAGARRAHERPHLDHHRLIALATVRQRGSIFCSSGRPNRGIGNARRTD